MTARKRSSRRQAAEDREGGRDKRPYPERFPPETWIERDGWGTGVVIAATDDILTVLLSDQLATMVMSGNGPVVWKLDGPPLDDAAA